MAERVVTVCDVCGEPASETVTLKVGNRTLLKDLCPRHVGELVKGTRRPKRGRRPGSAKTATAKEAAKLPGRERAARGPRRRRSPAPAASEPGT